MQRVAEGVRNTPHQTFTFEKKFKKTDAFIDLHICFQMCYLFVSLILFCLKLSNTRVQVYH